MIEDSEKIWALNYRMVMAVTAGVAAEVRTLGVEVKELFLLAGVDEHPHPAALADALAMPRNTVSAMVKRLTAAGVLRREIDPLDLRKHKLLLTPAGRRAAVRGMEMLTEAFSLRLARLKTSERAALRAALEKMGEPEAP